jgi:PKD repeat protein
VEVDFTAPLWSACNPLETDLTGTSVNGNDHLWFVDGNLISNNKDTRFRFINATGENRVFDVMFRSVSENGCFDDTVKQVTVYPKPQAWFIADPQVQDFNIINDLTPVNIENRTDFRSSWNFRWDFGDGTTSQQADEQFTRNYSLWGDIANENRINLSLIAENPLHPECADTMKGYIIINPPLPQVDLGNDISGCMPLIVDFPSVTKYNYPGSYEWDLGIEGMQSSQPVPGPLTYSTPGVYIVRLNVSGDGGSNQDYKKITVHPRPVADFTFDPDTVWVRSQIEDGTPVKFFNTTKNGVYYLWDFGDGSGSSEFQPQHEYLNTGSYFISLIAGSSEGCYDTLAHEIPVTVEGRGKLKYPNAILVYPGNPVDEHYDPGNPDPRIFRPVAEGIDRYRLEIYNRWGELIFVSEDVNKGWNGYINGSPAKQDVYVWRVTGSFTNGRPFSEAGDITLLIKNY